MKKKPSLPDSVSTRLFDALLNTPEPAVSTLLSEGYRARLGERLADALLDADGDIVETRPDTPAEVTKWEQYRRFGTHTPSPHDLVREALLT